MQNESTAANHEREKEAPPADRKKPVRWRLIFILAVIGLFLMGYVILYLSMLPKRPLANFFSVLEEQGYEPNIGFSGNLAPGNVIQTREAATDGGERQLNPPLVVLWREQCFPGKVLRETLYTLPESSGQKDARFGLGAEMLTTMMPVLQVDSEAAADYSMQLENTHLLSFAKLDLSQQFSEQCVRALENDLRLGNNIEWYGVILEAIIVDSIRLLIDWRENSTAAARTKVKNDAQKKLAAVVNQGKDGSQKIRGEVSLATDSKESTVIEATGKVIVGYRARQLQPIFKEE